MTYTKRCLLPLIFTASLLFHACGPSATVTVVEDTPRTTPAGEPDTLENGPDFHQLTLGMIEPVTNFDPLFAENLSTLRVLSLVYQGLYTLNPQGEPVPALAREVEISEDGREYEITINREIFYHDSELFTSGVGRRIHADDVKWAFERTARVDVPDHAARLLLNISGFENYFLEQRNIYDEEKRVLDGVEGIEVVSSNTLLFRLRQADPNFLQKLASPYLSIYPREIAEQPDQPLRKNPVGTGTYIFSGIDEDSIITFVHRAPEDVDYAINRIDIVHTLRESNLFQRFARNEVDWIPETGPQTYSQVFSAQNGGEISSSYSGDFAFTEHGAYRISSIYINEHTYADTDWLANRLNSLSEEDFSIPGTYSFQAQSLNSAESDTAEPAESYFVPFTENPFAQRLLSVLRDSVFQPESDLAFFDVRVATPASALFCRTSDSVHQAWNPLPEAYWLRLNTPVISLYQSGVRGIDPVTVPWLLNIENVRINRSQTSSL